jgi:hypothetical protein
VACFCAWQHFKLEGNHPAALASLIGAGLFAFAPVRILLGAVFAIERRVLHLVHLLGAVGLIAVGSSHYVSSPGLVSHAALAPFAMMGAAQAIMHQDHPRNAQQAAALRRFALSLREIGSIEGTDYHSPEQVARAIGVIRDILGKAQALGDTELAADPRFQSALARVSTRNGTHSGARCGRSVARSARAHVRRAACAAESAPAAGARPAHPGRIGRQAHPLSG